LTIDRARAARPATGTFYKIDNADSNSEAWAASEDRPKNARKAGKTLAVKPEMCKSQNRAESTGIP
jgi:predicted Zn-ribbon and HTH transcriptional regulator